MTGTSRSYLKMLCSHALMKTERTRRGGKGRGPRKARVAESPSRRVDHFSREPPSRDSRLRCSARLGQPCRQRGDAAKGIVAAPMASPATGTAGAGACTDGQCKDGRGT